MKKSYITLLVTIMLIIFASCCAAESAPQRNTITPADTTVSEQQLIEVLLKPTQQLFDRADAALYDFRTEEAYRRINLMVELYQDGKLIDYTSGTVYRLDAAEALSGRLAMMTICNKSHFEWTFLLLASRDGETVNRMTEIEKETGIDAALDRTHQYLGAAQSIEAGKGIILFASFYAEESLANSPITYPVTLSDYPYALLVKCVFLK